MAAAVADGYFDAGFTVVLEDVVAGQLLGEMRTMIRHRPCHVIVLVPSSEAIAGREAGRDRKGYGVWNVKRLRDGFVNETPRVGIWLDTSELTPQETVDAIVERSAAHTVSSQSEIVVADYDPEWPTLLSR